MGSTDKRVGVMKYPRQVGSLESSSKFIEYLDMSGDPATIRSDLVCGLTKTAGGVTCIRAPGVALPTKHQYDELSDLIHPHQWEMDA